MTPAARTRLTIAAALLAPAISWAEFTPERRYEEVADPPTQVRGHAVVGAALVPAAPSPQSDTLWVRPGKADKDLRIRADLASANGRLRGEGTWRFDPQDRPARTWYPLAVPPKAQRPDRSEHLAVAVQPERSDPGAPPVFLLAALGKAEPAGAARVRLYVNTRRAEVYVYLPDGKTAVRCLGIEGTQVVRFDATCDIDLAVGPGSGSARLNLVRRDGHQSSPPQPVDIRW